jgi:tellurite resistance protein TehA-like permease
MRLSKVPLEMNFPKRNDTLLIQRDNNFVGMTFMNIILKGIGIIIGLFIFLAIIGALFGSHDTPTPATTTSKITETNSGVSKQGETSIPAQQTQTSAPKPSQTLYPWGYAPGSMP